MKIICSTLNAKYIHTNLAIRYLKAYAEPEFPVKLAEYTINDPEMNIVTDIVRKQPDVIGFSCYIWNIEKTIKIIQMLKKINPSLTIILGGPEVTYDTHEWMEKLPEVDFIIIGEGEGTFKHLLGTIKKARNFSNVKGIAWRDSNGQIIINSPRPKLDLKTIPSPFRIQEDIPHLSKRVTYIETSRGCPFSCQFCLSSIEVGVRYFDREKVKSDIRYLMEHGARTIKFVDRTFNISRSYAMEMFQFLINEHYPGTVFQFEITADIMRPEVIEFLNKNAPAGLFRFEIGVQSTNDYTNELVKRKQNFNKLARTVTMVKNGGKIVQHLDLIAGLPEEDYHSFKKTFNDVFALRPEELQLGFLKLLRGTGLRNNAAEFQYQFVDNAPYEILSNRVLSFNDIIKIKQVEDVLDKYWNDHRMDHTIEYIVSYVFPTAFDFFQSFGNYWDDKGWSRIGHQLEDLFTRLKKFLTDNDIKDIDIIEGLMKIDYLTSHTHKPRKPWWNISFSKPERASIYNAILNKSHVLGAKFASLNLQERDLYKHSLLEFIPFDFNEFIANGTIKRSPSCLLAYFDPKNKQSTLYACALTEVKPAI